MLQEEVFAKGEGDAWFKRNQHALVNNQKIDWPSNVISLLPLSGKRLNVLELGCANGYRLAKLRNTLSANFTGIDISHEAVLDGRQRYAGIDFYQGSITHVPLSTKFDLVIVNFVLHWVDRALLLKAISEIDRLLQNGGYLVLGDFLPDAACRRPYHHLPGENVFTYKQDYAKAFETLGTYREIARLVYDHDNPEATVTAAQSNNRACCVALKKSLSDYYWEQV